MRPKLLDVTGIVFFGALTIAAALATPGASQWLGVWAAEISNLAIAVIAGLSIAFRAPFTLAYARETTDRAYWQSPLFLRINYVITAVWAAAFLVTAIIGYIGAGPLHQPDNMWTNWIIPIALVVLALKFTGWYPDHATADPDAHPAHGDAPRRRRPVAELFRPLAAYLVPVGIVTAILGGRLWWAGLVLIAVGVVITRNLHQATVRASARHTADGGVTADSTAAAGGRLPS
jgi:hypothetical protein